MLSDLRVVLKDHQVAHVLLASHEGAERGGEVGDGEPVAEQRDQAGPQTDAEQRERSIAALAIGDVKILVNVNTLTEGVDVPAASLCLLARGVG